MTPLEAAIQYARRGWAVFPCHSVDGEGVCTCGDNSPDHKTAKHPRTPNGVKDATTNEDVITRWFTQWPNSNIGLACGRDSNVIAIDVDPKHGGFESLEDFEMERPDGPLPITLKAMTGSGGYHLLFTYPTDGQPVSNRNPWLPGVDVKSDGGYIIVPPSTHATGAKYRWLNEHHPQTPPDDVVYDIRTRRRGEGGQGSDLPSTGDILNGVPEGQRDDVLFRACCRWRRQLKDREAVKTLALKAAANCNPPFPEEQALAKVAQAFKQDHSDDDDDDYEEQDDDGRHLTDHGNAQRLVDAYGDVLLHVEAWGWMCWDQRRWKVDTTNTIMAYARETVQSIYAEGDAAPTKDKKKKIKKHANASEAAGRISAMVTLAKSDDRVRRDVLDFDNDPWLISCRNGVVDLRTGELRPHSRDDFLTRFTNVVYDPDYELPQWNRFLEESCGGDTELMRFMQMASGYSMTGSTSEESLFIIHGPAASGKSTFIDGLQTALGEYGMVTQAETFMNNRGQGPPKDEIARFYGARAIMTVEIPEGERFAEALVKQLTGGDKVVGRHLYKSGFEYSPTYKLWFVTNHRPRIYDDAIWRRIKTIPFTHAVPPEKRNPQLKTMIRDPEKGGKAVLAWAVKGAVMWLNSGGLITPAVVREETDDYRAEQDKFGSFLASECVMGSQYSVSRRELYNRYQGWCMLNGEKSMTSTAFTQKMKIREENFKVVRRNSDWLFIGLAVKEPAWNIGELAKEEESWRA